MNNKVLLDSSILIEYLKGNKAKLLNSLIDNPSVSCYINETIVSEFYFHYLKLSTGKAPATVQASRGIRDALEGSNSYLLVNVFEVLPNERSVIKDVPEYMKKYNLLPNDAIILATCKIHNITRLASHDSDFILP
jgi:uncharacterized protein